MKRQLLRVKVVWKYIILIVSLFFVLFPLAWMLSSSFKSEPEMMALNQNWIPQEPTFEHYLWVLGIKSSLPNGGINTSDTVGLLSFLKNSIIISFICCTLVTMISLLAGFALARFDFKGKRIFSLFLLSTTFFPFILLLVPLYILLAKVKLIDTYFGLILVLTASSMPFSVMMLKGYINTIPYSLEECAMIDGCSRLGAFIKIIIPAVAPGTIAVIAYTFMASWGAYLEPLVICNSNSTKPVSIALAELVGFYGKTNWGGLMAGSVTMSIPIVVLFIFAQKWVVQGITAGAVKE